LNAKNYTDSFPLSPFVKAVLPFEKGELERIWEMRGISKKSI